MLTLLLLTLHSLIHQQIISSTTATLVLHHFCLISISNLAPYRFFFTHTSWSDRFKTQILTLLGSKPFSDFQLRVKVRVLTITPHNWP